MNKPIKLQNKKCIKFEDLFDLSVIQRIQDEFAAATGVASIITQLDGTPITAPSNFRRLCQGIIRCTEKGLLNCYTSDAFIGRHNTDGPIVQTCLSGGLWDAGASITVDGKHIANWLIGQIRDETQKEDKMREYADLIGADESNFIEAFREVPTMSLTRFKQIAQLLFTMANQLAEIAYQNIQQASDIEERKITNAALRENEERFRTVVSNIPMVIFMTDENGIFTVSEGMGLAKLGLKPGQVIGMSIFYMYRDYQIVTEAMKNALAGLNQRIELEIQDLVFDILISPVLDQNGGVIKVIGVANDITERKQAEKDREKLQEQLSQSQKMESIGRLAGGVAHDFNNMLGVIIGHTEIALGQANSSHNIFAALQEIQKAAQRSADLTRQLLAFARKQTIIPKVLDLNHAVSGMLKMLERLIGEDINLTWLPGKNLWAVKLDPSQIDQILANLCVNARDAIQGIGKITIETATATFDEPYCAHNEGFVPGDYVMLAVSDNGCGMSKDTLNKLFEPFFTTKETGKGTGLGLATVYGIVKQNSGFINVYSELNHGTTFKVYLPRHSFDGEQIKTDARTEPIAPGHETILLVEDEKSILEVTKMILEHIGYTVLAANTPKEAIRMAQDYQGKMHILVTDVVMPEMNGRDLSRKLLALYPHLKSIFMSGYTADVIGHHGMLDEGVHFIQKPFSIKDLANKIREALDNV